jgi:shikimate kinase
MESRSAARPRQPRGKSPLARPVVLIGAMAVGKTVIGAELARLLDVPFEDTDQVVVQRHGPVTDIFANHGEHHFRQLEARAVAGVLEGMAAHPGVVSLGGGAVLDSGTQQLLAGATVVYLEADRETVRQRIARNISRPMLAHPEDGSVTPAEAALRRWDELAAVREPVYSRLATLRLDVRTGSCEELARTLAAALLALPGAGAAHQESIEKDSPQ